jgi:hypothetical protein
VSTALPPSELSEWAEIRHPFHPRKGERFAVLKRRRVGGVDTLILRDAERGSFAVAREWTNLAAPGSCERADGSTRIHFAIWPASSSCWQLAHPEGLQDDLPWTNLRPLQQVV